MTTLEAELLRAGYIVVYNSSPRTGQVYATVRDGYGPLRVTGTGDTFEAALRDAANREATLAVYVTEDH